MKITKRTVKFVRKVAQDKKAENIILFDVRKITYITDFLVILSGNSSVHLDAISYELQEKLKEKKILPHHVEGEGESGWILLDYGNMIIHIFGKEERKFYNLERLWGDGKIIK